MKKLHDAAAKMHQGAAGLFAMLDKVETNEEGLMRRPNYIGTCHAPDGEKIWASIELLKEGMKAFEKFEAKRGGES